MRSGDESGRPSLELRARTQTIIRKSRISQRVEFIEAPTFTAFVAEYLEDDEYRASQLFLAGDPDAGDVMSGTGGFNLGRCDGLIAAEARASVAASE
jgi:hypothetical protein